MPITATPMTPAQSGGGPAPAMGGSVNPFASLSAPSFQFGAAPTDLSANSSNIMGLLAKQPTSVTDSIMPFLQQLYGMQAGATKSIFDQQGAQGAAQAQSDAMKRGLTGSSIEAAGIQGAYTSANQGYDQFLSQMLGTLGGQYTSAVTADVTQQNDYYKTLAAALGQEQAQNIQMDQFNRQLQAGIDQGNANNRAAMWSSIIGAGGTLGSALLTHGMGASAAAGAAA